jgi:hypothetical protein
MTFKPLTESLGEGVLMSFLEAFPAKISVAPAKEQASKESDLPCGRTWRESLEKFDLDTHTWKTHQCLWDEDLQPSSVILPKWGMMRSGVLWERTTLPPLTSGTESGSWPTPRSCSAMAATITPESANNPSRFPNLETVVGKVTWPTPTCQEVEHPDAELTDTGRRLSKDGKSSHSLNLADSVKQWPTPAASEGRQGYQDRTNGKKGSQESLTTVTVNYEGGRDKVSGQLNPDWVEWLMGWPIGWTSMNGITELDWRDWSVDPADESEVPRVATGIKHRVGRLKAIGNGQVPQVAAMAWRILSK